MKAHISDNSLTSEDVATLVMALNLFNSNEIEGISPERKTTQNLLALSVVQKLERKENRFDAEDSRIMYVALLYFRSIICETENTGEEDPTFDKDSRKYLSIIDGLLNNLKAQFAAGGIDIDAL